MSLNINFVYIGSLQIHLILFQNIGSYTSSFTETLTSEVNKKTKEN